jgi:hypothetical protein
LKPFERIIRIENRLVRQLLAEVFSTFLLVVIGVGSVAQYVLYSSTPSMSIAIAFSFSIAMGIVVAGNISGSDLFFLFLKENFFLTKKYWFKVAI